MKGFSRIWMLALGVAVALLLAIAAVLWPGQVASPDGNAQPASITKPTPSSLLKKTIEKIHFRLPGR